MEASPSLEKEMQEAFMKKAIEQAELVRGLTSPNPWVGAVVVPQGVTDLEDCYFGATEKWGGRHAEVVAIEKTPPERLANSTLLVTLEPCSHYGKTPPCTNAIIQSGIKRVVIGIEDPDPKVNTKGIKELINAGCQVVVGVCEDEVREQLRAYIHHRKTMRPYVVLKLAISLDGKIAASDLSSKWITSEQSREDAHRLRLYSDAILVGKNTYEHDKPSLDVRLSDRHVSDKLRIVLGNDLSLPEGFRSFSGDLNELLDSLGREGVLQLLVEGGAGVSYEFHKNSLVNEYIFYIAPIIFGGDDSVPIMRGKGVKSISEVWRGEFVEVAKLSGDIKVVVRPK